MKAGLKILFAIALGLAWYIVNGETSGDLALMIFFFVAFLLLIKPISFQPPEKREDYIQQLKRSYERKMDLQKKEKEEKRRLNQAATERDYKKRDSNTSLI
ncbi:hypothetical protein [Helicobacter ailurogastricus]|uniref:Conserved hypothetical integral membrane protein n=1 Tax=Helicobacter ailurogastricus TaxID=1578720 RepID=A0A0K2X8D9_9HELI|nr:hypothetical protein [Helicobacter ailurogastricus]CRF41813.1 hypothetical protein HAL011_16310 [Helicobacter ailurogastricus]CRF43349.1 hypothetical protein HAL013_15830 [Helicobacter ailurogastricus]CRF45047.1 hypothetical protein HAL09_16800 [Helicobacter ailurogastricus]CRF52286.1 conserved hypothetical integral membrane protein [Helicobacter ailurogastricus]BDQ29410.1 hypothetical protein ASB7_12470 [Helicobacter ailurogastricus]